MPGEADEQTGVIAVVRRPPFLAIGERRVDISLHGLEIELCELGTIIEIRAVGIDVVAVLAQAGEIDDVRPPALHVARGGFGLPHSSSFHGGLVEPWRCGERRQGNE